MRLSIGMALTVRGEINPFRALNGELRRAKLNCYNCKRMEELIKFTWNFRIISEKQHTLNQQYLIDPEISEKIIFLKRNGDE